CGLAGSAAGSRGRARPRISRRTALFAHNPQPGRSALLALVLGELNMLHRGNAAGYALAASIGLDPDAFHVRLYLAVAVGAHASARAVAQRLRAIHRTGHAGRTQHALTAHATVEQRALERL